MFVTSVIQVKIQLDFLQLLQDLEQRVHQGELTPEQRCAANAKLHCASLVFTVVPVVLKPHDWLKSV